MRLDGATLAGARFCEQLEQNMIQRLSLVTGYITQYTLHITHYTLHCTHIALLVSSQLLQTSAYFIVKNIVLMFNFLMLSIAIIYHGDTALVVLMLSGEWTQQ